MIAAIIAALDHRGAAKFTAPNHESIFEHVALFQIFDERGARLIGLLAILFEIGDEIAVLVPRFMEELHETNAALDQTPREEAIVGEGGCTGFGAVHFQDMFGLFSDIHQFGRAGLHAIGHFVRIDARRDFRISDHVEMFLIEFFDRVERIALRL